MERSRGPLAAAILGICLALPSLAQTGPAPARTDPRAAGVRAYGTTNWSVERLGATQFVPANSRTAYETSGSEMYSSDPDGYFHAVPHVPTGALLTYWYLDYCALVDGGDVWAFLWSCDHDDPFFSCDQIGILHGTVNLVCTAVYQDLQPTPYTVNNNTKDLYVEVNTKGGYLDSGFTGVSIYYQLQMSPAPLTATFADVPTNYLYFRAIEALAASRVTSGCGGGNFCPNQAVTRGEMAKFLAVALGLSQSP
jgi:hypothetical protein